MNSKAKKSTAPVKKKLPAKKLPPKKAPAKKQKDKGLGAKLIGKPDRLVTQLFADKKEAKWAIDQLTNEGPGHKQVLNALLVKQLSAFITETERASGITFSLQKGQKLMADHHGDKKTTPVHLTQAAMKGLKNGKPVLETLSKAPEHELLMYALLLQVIEWASLAIKKK